MTCAPKDKELDAFLSKVDEIGSLVCKYLGVKML